MAPPYRTAYLSIDNPFHIDEGALYCGIYQGTECQLVEESKAAGSSIPRIAWVVAGGFYFYFYYTYSPYYYYVS